MRVSPMVLVLSCAGLVSCQERDLTPTESGSPSASASAKQPATTLDAPARAAIEQALVVVQSCTLSFDEIAMLDFQESDRCDKLAKTDVAELDKRVDALLAARSQTSVVGLGATFVDEMKLYREWIDTVFVTKQGRGSAALYQHLARAWNQWKPDAHVEVDPQNLLMDYFGVSEDRIGHFQFYWKASHGGPARYEQARKNGYELLWVHATNGMYIGEQREFWSRLRDGGP